MPHKSGLKCKTDMSTELKNLQNNALRVINFAHFRDSSNALYYKTKVLKLNDCVKIQNFVYVLESIKGNLPHCSK